MYTLLYTGLPFVSNFSSHTILGLQLQFGNTAAIVINIAPQSDDFAYKQDDSAEQFIQNTFSALVIFVTSDEDTRQNLMIKLSISVLEE